MSGNPPVSSNELLLKAVFEGKLEEVKYQIETNKVDPNTFFNQSECEKFPYLKNSFRQPNMTYRKAKSGGITILQAAVSGECNPEVVSYLLRNAHEITPASSAQKGCRFSRCD